MTAPRKLELSTPSDTEIVMRRSLDAPRALVFEAHTRPELLRRWFYGPNGWALIECEIDLRVGGRYRYVWRGPQGQSMAASGSFQEVVAPTRIVRTEQRDHDHMGGDALSTTVLDEHDGVTTVTTTARYATRADRDAALASGMDRGIETSFARLAELLDVDKRAVS